MKRIEPCGRAAKSFKKVRPTASQLHSEGPVFTDLAVARHCQNQTGASVKKSIHTLQPLRTIVVTVGDQEIETEPAIVATEVRRHRPIPSFTLGEIDNEAAVAVDVPVSRR